MKNSNKWENRWITLNEYVDIETGEQLTEEQITNYIIIGREKEIIFNEKNYIRKFINHCKPSRQHRLF